MQLFYNPKLDDSVEQFSFSKEESHHIVKVLRKKEHDELSITNGKGILFSAKIIETDPKNCTAQIVSSQKTIPSLHSLHLAVAPTKMNDRYEWFLEKATEIGVHTVTPIICEHSERKVIKQERYEKVILSAMKQSLQTFLPELRPLTKFNDFVNEKHEGFKFIAHCADKEKAELKRKVAPDKNILILIGPEGDFSRHEIKMACEKGFAPVALGKNRLRTETAAIMACATVNMINS